MDFLETLGIATIPTALSLIYGHIRFKNELEKHNADLEKHNADMMSERAAKHYLSNPKFRGRTFKTLKRHLGGWDDDEDGLRRILVRAGAIRKYRTSEDGAKVELWELLGRDWNAEQDNDD